VRYERSPHLAQSLQLSAELAAAVGLAAPLDEDPADPPPDIEARLARAIRVCGRSIRAAKFAAGAARETQNFRVDPAAAYRARQLLAQKFSPAEISRRTGLGRKALQTIRRGDTPRPLNSQCAALERCPDCGGLVAADAPCLLCAVRARATPRALSSKD
jgi:hypothetical protein